MIVYITDQENILIDSKTVDENYIPVDFEYIETPPKKREGYSIVMTETGWVYMEDNRHRIYYDATSGLPFQHLKLGAVPSSFATSPRPTPHHSWSGSKWVIDDDKKIELKAQQQAQVWECIKQKRYQNGRLGVYVKSVDKWFHTDDASRQQYTFMRTLPEFPPTQWKTMDNSFVTMTKELLNELSLAMLANEQADFANAEKHRLAMLEAENPQDYDYSTGWREVYHGE
ncbi:uncharacterized protein DUF4376 [Pasteurella langaaensis DSM 22999]|uniref:Uncharacterized protein DUF4376 n=2 Tax=Alitibacter langaaensis TaxID=756 RepID=A0A2U0TAD4_9PAST|nr:uncharacterized protein DUF4376 [Pasteurella langaaensis DSM 22999]